MRVTAVTAASARLGAKVREDAIRFHGGRVSWTSKTALRAVVRNRALIETDQKARAIPTRSSQPWSCPKASSSRLAMGCGISPRIPGGPCSASHPRTASTRRKLTTATRKMAKGKSA